MKPGKFRATTTINKQMDPQILEHFCAMPSTTAITTKPLWPPQSQLILVFDCMSLLSWTRMWNFPFTNAGLNPKLCIQRWLDVSDQSKLKQLKLEWLVSVKLPMETCSYMRAFIVVRNEGDSWYPSCHQHRCISRARTCPSQDWHSLVLSAAIHSHRKFQSIKLVLSSLSLCSGPLCCIQTREVRLIKSDDLEGFPQSQPCLLLHHPWKTQETPSHRHSSFVWEGEKKIKTL